jgi:hypothetical protein
VVGLDDRQLKHLSKTHEGKKHDKKIGDEEGITVPVGSDRYRDSGFQGHDIPGVTMYQPKKKPCGGELSLVDNVQNRLIASVRVVVEHVIAGVKRCRIVKDIFRNTQEAYDDTVIELACGLHNFRSEHRLLCY